MPLPGAVLFPHALLPLYIFEDRYRDMLEHALQRDRMFSVTLIKPSCPEWRAPEDFFHLATVGLIRACVGRGDGTSNLVLQGLHRVRFSSSNKRLHSYRQDRHHRIAHDTATVETEALGEKVLELYAKLKGPSASFPKRSITILPSSAISKCSPIWLLQLSWTTLSAANGCWKNLRSISACDYSSLICRTKSAAPRFKAKRPARL